MTEQEPQQQDMTRESLTGEPVSMEGWEVVGSFGGDPIYGKGNSRRVLNSEGDEILVEYETQEL